ncbi:hypothetical protein [Streptomyces sp. OR43]|uniref:hypothetical protein n=1 Tax=Streptomyces sp. or43 TaxID=2478957 RepID=UPI0011CEA9ED|nr:hypothetical protein [Streptomyces sp. or43]TXS36926.1 hypothetical protein EAO72_26425 [Streptomyces sp. or43]
MARVRYIGAEPVTVPELGSRVIQPDEVVQVPDDRFEGYVCQPQVWEGVEEPKVSEAPAPGLKKISAAKAADTTKGA